MDVKGDELFGIVSQDLGNILSGVAQGLLDDIKSRTPVRTGKLKAGWELDEMSDEEIDINNNVPYAGYVEMGTPHVPPVGMVATSILGLENLLRPFNSE